MFCVNFICLQNVLQEKNHIWMFCVILGLSFLSLRVKRSNPVSNARTRMRATLLSTGSPRSRCLNKYEDTHRAHKRPSDTTTKKRLPRHLRWLAMTKMLLFLVFSDHPAAARHHIHRGELGGVWGKISQFCPGANNRCVFCIACANFVATGQTIYCNINIYLGGIWTDFFFEIQFNTL